MSGRARWSIGAAIFLGSWFFGWLIDRVEATGHLGGVVAVVGMGLLSWLVPVLLTERPTAGERKERIERREAEHLEDLTTGRAGYGQLRNLVVRVSDDTSAFLWKVERDGIYDVASATPGSAKVGGYGQQYSYTEFLLRMRPGRSASGSAQEFRERAEAERREREAGRGAA